MPMILLCDLHVHMIDCMLFSFKRKAVCVQTASVTGHDGVGKTSKVSAAIPRRVAQYHELAATDVVVEEKNWTLHLFW